MAGGAKVSYIVGGQGKKPDMFYRNVSAGKFTKATRQIKPLKGSKLTPETY